LCTNVKIIFFLSFFPRKGGIKENKFLFVTTHFESINKLLSKIISSNIQ
jgi:hypothetical protein